MLIKILAALLVTAALMLLLWYLRGAVLTPVKPGRNQRLSVVVSVTGSAPGLENTVDALLWLSANGTLPAEVVIRDAGMDAETRGTAEILSRRGTVKLID